MRTRVFVIAFAILALAGLSGLVTSAWAQMAPSPATSTPPPSPATSAAPAAGPAATGSNAFIAAAIILIGLLVVLGVAVKFFDLRRRREADAVHLQAQISDALLRDSTLFGLPITPTAHVPLWKGSPAAIEVSGQVPSAEVRDSVMRIVRDEAERIRPDFVIDDHLAIEPTLARAA